MTTGKIETVLDYSSDRSTYVCPECGGKHSQVEHDDLAAQRLRLESEVIEKAKAWDVSILQDASAFMAAENELRDSVKALLSFEAKQKK